MTVRPQRPVSLVEWFKVAGIICGALIAAGTVVHFVGAVAQSQVLAPALAAVSSERTERIAADTALHSENTVVLARLDEIRALLITSKHHKVAPDLWTEGGQPRSTQTGGQK